MSALVWSEILTLFVNTLTAHNKYSRCNVHNFAQQVQNAIVSKIKDFLSIFYCISEMCMQFRTFWRKSEYCLILAVNVLKQFKISDQNAFFQLNIYQMHEK